MKLSLRSNFSLPDAIDQNWVKQELFVRTHYVEGLTREFEKVRLLSTKKKQDWLKDNQKLLGGVLDTLMFDSDLAVAGVELDEQAAKMSTDFVSKLKKAAVLMKQIVRENRPLKN